MNRHDNPKLRRKIIQHLASQYSIMEVREPNHLSSFITCRTRCYLEQRQITEPTEKEVMLFALGYGLQDVITPKDAETPLYTKDGITFRPDMSFMQMGAEELGEIKTTRKNSKYHYIDDYIPVTWLDYMMGGCYIRDTNTYDLAVLYIIQTELYCDTFEFTDRELKDNWAKILEHKAVIDEALAKDETPTPFQHCYDWECKFCRFDLVCQTLARELNASNPIVEQDKEAWE